MGRHEAVTISSDLSSRACQPWCRINVTIWVLIAPAFLRHDGGLTTTGSTRLDKAEKGWSQCTAAKDCAFGTIILNEPGDPHTRRLRQRLPTPMILFSPRGLPLLIQDGIFHQGKCSVTSTPKVQPESAASAVAYWADLSPWRLAKTSGSARGRGRRGRKREYSCTSFCWSVPPPAMHLVTPDVLLSAVWTPSARRTGMRSKLRARSQCGM